MNAFSFSQKFGVYSLIISGAGVFLSLMVPNFGVLCAGLAGIVAWMSAGSGVFIGVLTVMLNLINLFIFCDISRIFPAIEATARTPDQNRVIVLWLLVFLVQVAAIMLFLLFFALKLLFGREKVVHDYRGTVRPDSANSAAYIGEVTSSGEWYKTIYALIVLVLFCLTVVVYVRPGLLPLTVFSSAFSSFTRQTPAESAAGNKISPPIHTPAAPEADLPTASDTADIPDVIRSLKAKTNEPDSHITVTADDVQRAVKQIVAEKIREKESSAHSKLNSQYYIIELWNGSQITTQNLKISDDEVIYRDAKGYEIAIDRAEITSVKRYSY